MKPGELKKQVSLGEDSTRQFKVDVRNAESLASEMAAFANSEGGTMYIGVADDGARAMLETAATLMIADKGALKVQRPAPIAPTNAPLFHTLVRK